MSFYSKNARGIWLLDNNTVTDAESLRQFDYIVIDFGMLDKPSIKYAEHYEAVKDLGKPIIGYVQTDAEKCIGWTFNPAVWPNEQNDPLAQMVYRMTKYPNGSQRNISAWIVDGSKRLNKDKNDMGDNWVAEVFRHEVDKIFKRMRKPVYPFVKKDTAFAYGGGSRMVNVITSFDGDAISTYEPALKPVSIGIGTAYIPGDTDAIQQPYAGSYSFWFYGTAVIPGVTGAVCLFLFHADKTTLYGELSFTPPATTTPPSTPPGDTNPGTPPATEIPADLGGKIDALTISINGLTVSVNALTAAIKPFFSKF